MTEPNARPQKSAEGTLLAPNAIRVFAIFGVILFHVSSDYASAFDSLKDSWLWVGNLINGPTHIAIPMFFILSGSLLLSKYEESHLDFFRKRFIRVVPPFLFYVGVFFAWRILYQGKSFTFKQMISDILNFRLTLHFWFVYAIVGLYLLTPILRVIVNKGSKTIVAYMIALWLLNMSVLPLIDDVFGLEISAPYVFLMGGYVGYYLLGYLLKDIHLTRRQIFLAVLVIFACFAITIGATLGLSLGAETPNTRFYSDVNLFNVAAASAAFLVLNNLPYQTVYRKYPFLQSFIDSISEVSYGVYLLHPLMLIQLERGTLGFEVDMLVQPPLLGISIMWVFTAVTSIVIVWLLHKIPGVKHFAT